MPTNNSNAGYRKNALRKPHERVKYRRKPKAERVPPVKKFVIEHCSFEDAVLDVALSNKTHSDPPILQKIYKESLSYHTNERGATLVVQQSVMRWNKKAEKPYSVDETVCVRTIFLTSKGNVHYYFYDVIIDRNGRKTRQVRTAYDPSATFISSAHTTGSTWQKVMREQENEQRSPFMLLRAYFESVTGKSCAIDDVYPMREYLGQTGNTLLPGSVMRVNTPQEVAVELFGKRMYRKDLVKAIGKDSFASVSRIDDIGRMRAQRLYWAWLFKGLVPTDWIVDYLANNRVSQGFECDERTVTSLSTLERQTFRKMISWLKPAERRNVLNSSVVNKYTIDDLTRAWLRAERLGQLDDILPAHRDNIKSFADYHDKFFAAQRHREMIERRKRDAERYLPSNMWVNSSQEANKFAWFMEHMMPMPDGLTARIARDYDTLFKWSDYMNNCISSYFSHAGTILGGIYRGEELIANFEIYHEKVQYGERFNYYAVAEDTTSPVETEYLYKDTYTVKQLLGIRNSRLNTDLRDMLAKHFKSAGISISDGIWW